jgi:hypothetical protein
MEDLNIHIDKTWKRYSRKSRSTNPDQIVPYAFLSFDGRVWSYEKEAFYQHAFEQGATTRHELEFFGDPIYMDGQTFQKTWQWNVKWDVYFPNISIQYDCLQGFYYYPLEQMKWTSHKELAKRKTPANLTSHGHQHFKSTYKKPTPVTRIRAWNETKTANAWSKDARAKVSDKIITRRILKGWIPEDAISTPANNTP